MNKFITNFKVMPVNTAEIFVPEEYQREFKPYMVKKILKNWDDNVVNMPKVSKRNGKYWVFDGQHTIAALKSKNDGQDIWVLCQVFEGLTIEEEANLFRKQRGATTAVHKNEDLRAAFNVGDKEVVQMVEIAKSCGCIIDFRKNKKSHCCVALNKLVQLYENLSTEQFKEMLTLIEDGWNGDPDGYIGYVMGGLALFIKTYWGKYNRKVLLAKMQKTMTAAGVISDTATVRTKTDKTIARAILNRYNANMHTGKGKLEDEF